MDDFVFVQTLTTQTGSTHVSMVYGEEEDGEKTVFLNRLMEDTDDVLSVRIQTSDANDILQALIQVNQMLSKAVTLGEYVC